jgi:hypothetical protein
MVMATMVILTISFYWFQIRPARTYKFCHAKALVAAVEMSKARAKQTTFDKSDDKEAEEGWYVPSDYENSYKKCLRSRGLEH